MLKLNWKNVLGAIVSAILAAVIGYILSVADIFSLDFKELINVGVLAGLASILKVLSTDDKGLLIGSVPVK